MLRRQRKSRANMRSRRSDSGDNSNDDEADCTRDTGKQNPEARPATSVVTRPQQPCLSFADDCFVPRVQSGQTRKKLSKHQLPSPTIRRTPTSTSDRPSSPLLLSASNTMTGSLELADIKLKVKPLVIHRQHQSKCQTISQAPDSQQEITHLEHLREQMNALCDDTRDIPISSGTEEVLREQASSASTYIPDATAIHQARQKRQLMRKVMVSGEIPLLDANDRDLLSGECESDDSESDSRILPLQTSTHLAAKERQKTRDEFLTHEQGSDQEDGAKDGGRDGNDSDDTFSAWEIEQIRKGVGIKPQGISGNCDELTARMVDAARNMVAEKHHSEMQYLNADDNDKNDENSIPEFKKQPTVEEVRERIVQRLESLQITLKKHKTDRSRLIEMQNIDETQLGHMENVEKRFHNLVQLRAYATDIFDCYSEKAPFMDDIERAALELYTDHRQKIVKRRHNDVKDQDLEFAAAKSVTDCQTCRDPRTPLDPDRQQHATRREARRAARLSRIREYDGKSEYFEGLSSDDDDIGNDVAKQNAESQLMRKASLLMSDVNKTFCDIVEVLVVLSKYLSSNIEDQHQGSMWLQQTGALIGLALRKDTMLYNPLTMSITKQKWFLEMSKFEFDNKTYTGFTCDTMCPRLLNIFSRYVQAAYDPCSKKETVNLVDASEKLIGCCKSCNTDNRKLLEYLEAVVKVLHRAVEEEVFLPLYPKVVIQNVYCGASRFFQRRIWFHIKLMKNILQWSKLLSQGMLISLAIEQVLNKSILMGLRFSDMNWLVARKCEHISDCIPLHWLSELTGEDTLPELKLFCNYMKDLVVHLRSEQQADPNMLQRLRSSLLKLHAYNCVWEIDNEKS